MSCLCEKYNLAGESQACPCDEFVFPVPLNIPAGLDHLPRQIAVFPEFRRAMLAATRAPVGQHPLEEWRARAKDDLGIMLLEMWAYICDNLSFYDEVIAQEAYLRTAFRRPSLRRLVDLLGYLPVPAVAARAELAALADGRNLVKLPVGTAFRSKGFDDEAPQVFELDKEAVIHPLTNNWNIEAPHPGIILKANPQSLLIQPTTAIGEGSRLLIIDTENAGQNQVATVSVVTPHLGADGKNYTSVVFKQALTLSAGTTLDHLKVFAATQRAALYTISGNAISSSELEVTLDKQYQQMHAGDYILITRAGKNRWYELTAVEETMKTPISNPTIEINQSTFKLTPIKVPVSKITLDVSLNDTDRLAGDTANWGNSIASELTVHYHMVTAGKVVDEAKTTLITGDELRFTGRIEKPADGHQPEEFFLQDKNKEGLLLKGEVDFTAKQLKLDQGQEAVWPNSLEMTLPVEAFGNVIRIVRGESVDGEIIGSGDAATPSQAFKLKKKPLTYLPAPTAENDSGVINTLRIYVNGVLWRETSSFFGMGPEDQVYIVRQDDEDESIVTFGDGERGQRLPSGTDNIKAWYRFGAGAAAPPADSITQISKPAEGLRSVKNPLPAYGGAEAETADEMQTNAPRSILTLGRAVSIQDMEAIALAVAGVRVVQSGWYWDGIQQRPVVKIWYVGAANLREIVTKRLRNLSDPSTPFGVEMAAPQKVDLSIDVQIDPRYLEEQVLAAVYDLLMQPGIGMLLPEKLLIGRPLYRSRIFETVLRAEGVTGIRNIQWNQQEFKDFAKAPGAGKYFDFENGNLLINGNSFAT
ncbi:MAG: hypothetical protein R2824_25495 [Saprospiraceae bacterium]|nr:hypothetical protein [Lewinella sp.]